MQESVLAIHVGTFARTAEGTSSTLYIHRAVETTVDALGGLERGFSGMADLAAQFAEDVEKIERPETVLDPDDYAVDAFARAADLARKVVSLMVRKRTAAQRSPELHIGQQELLSNCYESAMSALSRFEDEITRLRCAVIAHDLEAEKPIGPFNSVDELMKALA